MNVCFDFSLPSVLMQEEERNRFHLASKMMARPSSVAFEMDRLAVRNLQTLGDSILGQVRC